MHEQPQTQSPVPMPLPALSSAPLPSGVSAVDGYLARLGPAYAARTRQSMASDWRSFSAWCAQNDLLPFPATPEVVIAYLAALYGIHRLSTLRRRVATLSHLHRALGAANPMLDEDVRLTLRGLARL